MGSVVGKAMDENMKKQQDFMLKNQITVMERQIQMQNQMRERQQAMMVARSRDFVQWFGAFCAVVFPLCIVGAMKTKKPGTFAPVIPLSFVLAYNYDMAYYTKIKRMRDEADRILDDEQELLLLPHSLPTVASIDAARVRQSEENRVKQSHDLFL